MQSAFFLVALCALVSLPSRAGQSVEARSWASAREHRRKSFHASQEAVHVSSRSENACEASLACDGNGHVDSSGAELTAVPTTEPVDHNAILRQCRDLLIFIIKSRPVVFLVGLAIGFLWVGCTPARSLPFPCSSVSPSSGRVTTEASQDVVLPRVGLIFRGHRGQRSGPCQPSCNVNDPPISRSDGQEWTGSDIIPRAQASTSALSPDHEPTRLPASVTHQSFRRRRGALAPTVLRKRSIVQSPAPAISLNIQVGDDSGMVLCIGFKQGLRSE